MEPYESVKEYIRVMLVLPYGEKEADHFDYNRQDYRTEIDAGFENLSLRKDATKIMLYMQNDVIVFNNNRKYRVLKREYMPCVPVMLNLYVEEIK